MKENFSKRVQSILKKAKEEFGFKKLCLSGGLFLNCSLNGKILQSKLFDEIFVQPASSDDGAAIGACFLSHKKLKSVLENHKFHNVYLGSTYSNSKIEEIIKTYKIDYKKPENIFDFTAKKLKNKKIVGWFQDGAEFGPRALGNRSILTAPFPKEMKDVLNSRVKFREEFRPFAPAILNEFTQDYFEIAQESPHMLITSKVKTEKIDEIPAVTHIDGTGRVQTVTKEINNDFHLLIEKFYQISNVPILLNTSFNENEPIVMDPDQAIKCFLRTNMDVLVLNSYIIKR